MDQEQGKFLVDGKPFQAISGERAVCILGGDIGPRETPRHGIQMSV